MKMRSVVRAVALLLLCVGLLGALPARAESIDAFGLIREMGKGVALIEKDLLGAGVKADTTPKAAFMSALRKAAIAIDRLDDAAKAKSASFLAEIARADRYIERMYVAYTASTIGNAGVASTIEKIREASRALQKEYGPAAVRLRKGGELTGAERQSYDKMRAQVETLRTKIKDVQARSPQVVRDPAFGRSMADILLLLAAFEARQVTLDAYVRGLQCYGLAYDLWWANTSYWGYYYPLSAPLFTVAGPIWIDCGSTYTSIVDVSSYTVTDWTYLDQDITIQENVTVDISDADVTRYQSDVLELNDDVKLDAALKEAGVTDLPDLKDKDTDKDGIPDVKDKDDDNDGTPDIKDKDSNNDGVPDVQSDPPSGGSVEGTAPMNQDGPPAGVPDKIDDGNDASPGGNDASPDVSAPDTSSAPEPAPAPDNGGGGGDD